MIYPVVFDCKEVDVVDQDGAIHRVSAMVPQQRYRKVHDRQYHIGESYPLVILEARSRASHDHYFAALQEGFNNLPETISTRWPTVEHMRKWLLVECGFFDEKDFDFDGDKHGELQARRLGTFIRTEDSYARISIGRFVDRARTRRIKVLVRRAKSQSTAAMGKADFEASKKAVLDLLEHFTQVPRGTLRKEAGRNG